MKKTAVVFVHGHMGSVRQFAALTELLKERTDLDCVCISLPGHDGALSDFVESDRFLWKKWVNDRLAELRGDYDGLILVGHSMGGLLLIQGAIEAPEKLLGIVAISLPTHIRLTVKGLWLRLRCIGKPRAGEPEAVTVARKMNGVSGVTVANSLRLLPNTLGLLRVMAETRRVLHKLTVPLTIVQSEQDEIVSMKTARFVRKTLPNADVVLLKQASHFWFPPSEIQFIKSRIESYCP